MFQHHQSVELPFKGIYRISPSGVVTLLDSTFDKPNGICFSPDEKKLYVDNTPTGEIFVFDVVDDSVLSPKKLFYTVSAGGVDGMKVDSAGNIYSTSSNGIWIISPEGNKLGQINMSVGSSNCAWGDADRKTLYITGSYGNGLYKIRLAPATEVDNKVILPPTGFQLYANYPNPFNPTTTISFTLPLKLFVSLKIFDALGKEVAVLVSGEMPAGKYSKQWNASGLPSGIYYYSLEAGSFVKTEKLVLLK